MQQKRNSFIALGTTAVLFGWGVEMAQATCVSSGPIRCAVVSEESAAPSVGITLHIYQCTPPGGPCQDYRDVVFSFPNETARVSCGPMDSGPCSAVNSDGSLEARIEFPGADSSQGSPGPLLSVSNHAVRQHNVYQLKCGD